MYWQIKMRVTIRHPQKNNIGTMQSSFVLLPERLACFTLAPSAPD